ncbi:MAG TPA: hypothetical protein VNO21_03470 [Polyangiaceae bacterium]|nr:hypothetical protein [Polyangiaceae bacterium]
MDTTAKVDIRKLQLLNDRIAQTIEALNQVRLSVHGLGLSHTSGGVPGLGFGNVGINAGVGYGVPFQGVPFQANPFQNNILGNLGALGALNGGMLPGISHTSPYGFHPQGIPGAWQVQAGLPLQQNLWNQAIQNSLGQLGQLGLLGGGLAHTSPDVFNTLGTLGYGIDPFTAARIAQSFPFVGSAVPVGY